MSGNIESLGDFNPTNSTNVGTKNCSLFGHEKELATVTMGSASLSILACLIVLLLVCGLRKCHVLSQRLVLYLAVAVIIRSISWVQVTVHYNFHPSFNGSRSCTVAGYILTVTGWFEFMAITCLSTNLLLNMVSKKSHRWQEVIYFLFTFVVPFTVAWIPFAVGSYGETGFYCWIRAQTDLCRIFIPGLVFQFLLWYVPLLLALSHLLLLYWRVMCIVSQQKRRWDGHGSTGNNNKPKRREIRQIIFFPLVYFLLHLIPLAAQLSLVFISSPVYTLWFLSAISQPLQGGLFTIVVALDNSTIRRLRRQNLSATVLGLTQSVVVEDYPTRRTVEDQSYEQSEKTVSSSSEDEMSNIEFEEDEHSRERRAKYVKFSKY